MKLVGVFDPLGFNLLDEKVNGLLSLFGVYQDVDGKYFAKYLVSVLSKRYTLYYDSVHLNKCADQKFHKAKGQRWTLYSSHLARLYSIITSGSFYLFVSSLKCWVNLLKWCHGFQSTEISKGYKALNTTAAIWYSSKMATFVLPLTVSQLSPIWPLRDNTGSVAGPSHGTWWTWRACGRLTLLVFLWHPSRAKPVLAPPTVLAPAAC